MVIFVAPYNVENTIQKQYTDYLNVARNISANKGKFEEKEVYLIYFFFCLYMINLLLRTTYFFAQEVKCMSTEKASTVSCSICIVVQSSM